MYLNDTTLAPAGSWRATKIQTDLVSDIASAIAYTRSGDGDLFNGPYIAEAERWLRMFVSNEGRYPADFLDLESRFPGCLEHGVKLRLVTAPPARV